MQGKSTGFVQYPSRTHQIRMMLDQEPGAELGARLLVGHRRQHQVAIQCDARPAEREHQAQVHRTLSLHVDRAAAPYATLDQFGAEGARLHRAISTGTTSVCDESINGERHRPLRRATRLARAGSSSSTTDAIPSAPS